MINHNNSIGVIGAGAMGIGIAQIAATYGHLVFVYDNSLAALQKGEKSIQDTMSKLVSKEKITEEMSKNIKNKLVFIQNLEEMQSVSLVIEAIVENLAIKKDVFKKVEEFVSDKCILASNTSSLSITSIASGCKNPNRVIGIHFFNPAPIMPLVEIIPAIQSELSIVEEAFELIKLWGKTPVKAKDTPGFIVNRIARPYYSEALRIYDEGIASMQAIDAAMTQYGGFKMGPFELMDFIGHDVNFVVTESTYRSFYEEARYKPSLTQKKLVEAGWLGKKTGRGFFNYSNDATFPRIEITEDQANPILHRILAMLMNEAADALYYGISDALSLDLAMTKGVNYPKGLLAWADEWGLLKVVDILDQLFEDYHEERYRCSRILRLKVKKSELFLT